MSTKTPRNVRTPGAAGAPEEDKDAATSAAAPAADDLPNAIDIDAKAIKGPVLTKQGWVCPDESGRKPLDALKP